MEPTFTARVNRNSALLMLLLQRAGTLNQERSVRTDRGASALMFKVKMFATAGAFPNSGELTLIALDCQGPFRSELLVARCRHVLLRTKAG